MDEVQVIVSKPCYRSESTSLKLSTDIAQNEHWHSHAREKRKKKQVNRIRAKNAAEIEIHGKSCTGEEVQLMAQTFIYCYKSHKPFSSRGITTAIYLSVQHVFAALLYESWGMELV